MKINIIYTKYNVWSIIYFVKAYVREVNVLFDIFTSTCKDRGNVCCSKEISPLLDISVGPTSVRALVTRFPQQLLDSIIFSAMKIFEEKNRSESG